MSTGFTWPKMCLLGDSLTRRSKDPDNGCWGSLLANWAIDTFDVHVRAIEGNTSKWLLEMLPKCFKKSFLENTEVMVICIGANDAWDLAQMHVSVIDYQKNLQSIITYLTKFGLKKNKIIFITAPWYNKPAYDEYLKRIELPPMSKTLEECAKYSDAMKAVAAQHCLRYLDFFSMTADYTPLSELFVDGLHLSRKGAEMLYDGLTPLIDHTIQRDYSKPLAQIKHIKPFDQRPEMYLFLQEYKMSLRRAEEVVNVDD